LLTFLLQAFLMILYYLTMQDLWMIAGVLLFCLVAVANLVILLFLFPAKGNSRPEIWRLLRTTGLMLLNVPVAIFCFWAGSQLLNTVRITLTNPHSTTITDLVISGCKMHTIATLPPGGKQIVWVSIPGDCSIHLQYQHGGQVHQETVMGYCTGNMGMKIGHELGKGADQWSK
jgi:hypothetical protein